jgi:Winged helix-turn helix
MRGPRPAACTFPDPFLQAARRIVRQRTAQVQDVQRCRLALLLHNEPLLSNQIAAEAVGLSERQVRRWRQRWSQGDFSIADLPGRGRKVSFSPAGSRVGHGHRL